MSEYTSDTSTDPPQQKSAESSTISIPSWELPWLIFGVLIVIAIVFLIPTKVIDLEIEVPYVEVEQYTVDIPYEAIEEYVETVPYQVEEQYVEAIPYQEVQTVYEQVCEQVGNDTNCFFLPTQQTVTNYKDVIKSRTVTKYRNETKYRVIIQNRTELREREVQESRVVSCAQEVNLFFGFDALIKFHEEEVCTPV